MKNNLLTGDCREILSTQSANSIDLVIVDPPYNIGYNYGEDEYDDNQSPDRYAQFSRQWIEQVHRVLVPYGSFWLIIGDEWAADLQVIARQTGFHLRSWVVWYYTFGVNCTDKFNRSHAHLLYFTKHKNQRTFNKNDIRVPSARMLEYNDKRANPEGRLPDDTWILRPQIIPEAFQAESDTWTIPRVCGTFKQRQKGAANQLPEQLVGRIIRACSNKGDVVLDPMAGTGTVLATAIKLERNYMGIELSPKYSKLISERLAGIKPGDMLDGPIPQGG